MLLAVVDGGVERYLAALGERPRQPLVAMCPVSMRDEGDLEATTKVATMFVPMARPRSGAARRLQQIIANSGAAKQEFRALSKAAALDYALIAFGVWFASHTLGMEALTRPVVNLVISNVGGLPGERYLGDLRLAGAYPVSMIADPVGLNVSAVSLGGRMDFGIVANRAVVPDAGEIARHCLAAWTLLRKAARSSGLGLEESATAQAVAQATHAAEPAVVVRGLALEESQHLRVGQDQESSLLDAVADGVAACVDGQHARHRAGRRAFARPDDGRRDVLRADRRTPGCRGRRR